MTVHTRSNKVQYTGNGSARVWSYTFPCADEDWLKLYVTSGGVTTQVLNDYAVDLDDKTVTYPVSGTALTSQQTLTILRVLPLEQSLDLVNQGALEAESIEAALDEIVQMVQQIDERQRRTVMAGVVEDAPSFDYDALHAAGVLAQEMGTRAQNAAISATTAAAQALAAASSANTATTGANTAKNAANAAATAAQAVADAVVAYTTRAETAAELAEADAIKAYSNAQKAHQYFCAVWGTLYPFIRWFMVIPILDGKCSLVFCRNPSIVDGGDSTFSGLDPLALPVVDGQHADPMDWVSVNPIVLEFLEAVPQVKNLIAAADVAKSALELTIVKANEARDDAQAVIDAAKDWAGPMLQVLTGGEAGQFLMRTVDGWEWVDLQ